MTSASDAVPAFFGLGQMGAALARRMVGEGPLIASDLSAPARAGLAASGATAIASPAELECVRRVVLTCLPTSGHVEQLLFGAGDLAGRLAAGSTVIDMSTGDPDVSIRLAALLAARGIDFADAPVSGGPQAADAGTIMIMVGAPADLFDAIRPLLQRISPQVSLVGGIGAGHTMKLVNNMLAAGNRLLAFEAVALAASRGLDVPGCIAVLNRSSGRNNATEVTFPRHILTDTIAQNFALGLGLKDVALAQRLLPDRLRAFALLPAIERILETSVSRFGADSDINEMIRLYEEAAGAQIAGCPVDAGASRAA